jgi:BTB/POZ domain
VSSSFDPLMVDTTPKRRRPDEALDEDIYFEDGNVVLSAKDDGDNLVYFQVHKSILAKQSAVFKDMFSLPSPSVVEKYNDLPLVHLHDNAKDLKVFLQAMYDPT